MPQGRMLHYGIARHRLDNGLQLIVSPDPSSPAVAVNLWYHVGSGDEVAGRSGFAHLFEHLMFQGSSQVASGDHLSSLQAVGGAVNATTSFDRTNYFETVPPGAVDYALWLEADRLTSLDVSQANLGTQREVVKEEKRQRYDNVPYGDQLELLLALNFPSEHPYGHTTIGSMADLDEASLADVQGFFADWYCPSNLVLTLAGNIDEATATDLVARHFGDLPAGATPQRTTIEPLPQHTGVPLLSVQREVPRDAFHLAWRTPAIGHPDHLAVEQALAVLGQGPAARLHRLMVRETETAEGVGASQFGLARGTSLALVSGRAREGHDLAELEQQVVEQLLRLADDGPTDAELDRANAGYEREWLSELAQVDNRADQLSAFTTLQDDPDLLNRHLEQITSVRAEDVARVTRTWLHPDTRSVLHYRQETR